MTEGGTLQSPAGLLAIDELTPIAKADITVVGAKAAGHETVDDVLDTLRLGDDRTLYRIRFHRVGDDPRVALRADVGLDAGEVAEIDAQLDRWDAASRTGPWTAHLLRAIAASPATPSRILAGETGTDQARLKRRVRQIKGLGLTESLETGYQLSARGETYVARTERR